jgi:hypothetical protein
LVDHGAGRGDQVVGLEHEPDLSSPDVRELVIVQPGHFDSVEQVTTRGGQIQTTQKFITVLLPDPDSNNLALGDCKSTSSSALTSTSPARYTFQIRSS